MATKYSDIWGEDFSDVLDALGNSMPDEVENLILGKINNLSFSAQTFANNINQQVAVMTTNGLSQEAIKDVLRADMQESGRIFGQLKNDAREQVSGAINQSSRLGQNKEYGEKDKFIWVTVAGHKVCGDCAYRAGKVTTYRAWEKVGLPGTGWSVCKGYCYCIIDPIGRMGSNVNAPLAPEVKSKASIKNINDKAAAKIKDSKELGNKSRKLYEKVFKLDSKSAKEMLQRKGMTAAEAQKFIATHRIRFASVKRDTKTLHTLAGKNERYTRDRAILHNRIARSINQQGQIAKSGTKPDVLMTGGYPGSGKSTTLDKVFKGWEKKYVHIDSDHVKSLLAQFDDTTITWNAGLYHEEADDVLNLIFQKAFQDNRHVLYDGTMKTTQKMITFVDDFCIKGPYRPTMAVIDLPMEKAIERAIGRALGGNGLDGRFVDPTYMLSHYDIVKGLEKGKGLQTYESLKKAFSDIIYYARYNNDVAYGKAPIKIEQFIP